MVELSKTSDARSRVPGKLLILLVGIAIGQVILYGPSLVGCKILLPLDILAKPGYYVPQTPELAGKEPHNRQLQDLVDQFEPARFFAVSELHAGRLPMWMPGRFAGAPFVWPKFSPFFLLECSTRSPVILAWVQLVMAMVSGLGAYAFCRRVLGVNYWPAVITGWCYPLTGFFVLWQGYSISAPVTWLPWLLLAVNQTIRRTSPLAPAGLGVVSGLVLTSGQLDVAGEVLLASALFGLWCYFDLYRKQWFRPQALRTGARVVLSWGLGFLLASPEILPMLEYAKTGSRMAARIAGAEERPPIGIAALPQVVLPKMYGSVELGASPAFPEGQRNLMESTAATYAGVLATLLVAPLAFCSRRHRSLNAFWVVLGFFALGWSLKVPGLVDLLRLPGLNMMSYNRFVFAATFAILALTAVGLDVLSQGQPPWRWWFWLPTTLLTGLCLWSVYRTVVLPEPIQTQLQATILQGGYAEGVHDLAGVLRVQSWFTETSAVAAALCGMGVAGWLLLWGSKPWRPWLVPALGTLLSIDLLLFGFGRAAQCDPALYFPRIPVLEEIRKSVPGRIIGSNCLPANLAVMAGLRDIRGYDGVDPGLLMDVLKIASDPQSTAPRYARSQWLIPKVEWTPAGDLRFSPVLDMLSVRYLILRGLPPPQVHPAFQGPDYWVLVNSNALPRAYVPSRVEVVSEAAARLEKLSSPLFEAREVAYVEAPVEVSGLCRGVAEITDEIPTRIKIAVRMEAPGLVVLADLWDKSWRAYLNGQRLPILRANHAIRGVVVPPGSGTLEFRYQPASFAWGLRLAGLGVIVMVIWAGTIGWNSRRTNYNRDAK